MSVGSYHVQGPGSNNSSNSNSNNGCEAPMPQSSNNHSSSVRLAGDNTKDRMYEPKHRQKAVRVLTVIAYIFFVSLAAIKLSLYYLLIYNPSPPQPSNATNQMYGGGPTGGGVYPAPIIINITDCKQVIAVMNRSLPNLQLETPRVLSVRSDDSRPPTTTTEMSPEPSNQLENNDVKNVANENNEVNSNTTQNADNGSVSGDYSKYVNNNIDYYK